MDMLNVLGTAFLLTLFSFFQLKYHTFLACCVTIRVLAFFFLASMCVWLRLRDTGRKRQGWMWSLTGPPAQLRLMETIITQTTLSVQSVPLSPREALCHTCTHTQTHLHTQNISVPYPLAIPACLASNVQYVPQPVQKRLIVLACSCHSYFEDCGTLGVILLRRVRNCL